MKIFPAIDLRDGKVVRLLKGDYDKMTVYGEDPLAAAKKFAAAGAEFLHVVDLDGAKDGETPNFETVKRLAQESGLKVEIGGGIRDEETIKKYLDVGVYRVILGTIAVKDPDVYKRQPLMTPVSSSRFIRSVTAGEERLTTELISLIGARP